MSPADVIDVLDFPVSLHESDEETTTKGYLIQFLQKADAKMLHDFLIYTTGAPCLSNFGLGKITVKFETDPSIFASTCLKSLTLPRSFPDQAIQLFGNQENVLQLLGTFQYALI